jgi:hypothetical protein
MAALQLRDIILPSVHPGRAGTLLERVKRFDKKLNNTIIDIKPFSARNRILFSTGR